MPIHYEGSSFEQVFYGAQSIEEVYSGSSLVWKRRRPGETHLIAEPGEHTVQVPHWARYMYLLLYGAGSGGQAGEGSRALPGTAGDAGQVEGWVAYNVSSYGGQHFRFSIGAGGAGGAGHPYQMGKPGGDSTVTWPSGESYVAKGGEGNGKKIRYWTFGSGKLNSDTFDTAFPNSGVLRSPMEKGSEYFAISGYLGSAANAGADGAGGIFGRFSPGGKGGDGLALISFWTHDPLA